jgi:beta-galactosidase GanA
MKRLLIQLVIAPALTILNARRVEALKQFVAHGGHLVLTIRTGMKDEFNALLPMRQPGPLVELTGWKSKSIIHSLNLSRSLDRDLTANHACGPNC